MRHLYFVLGLVLGLAVAVFALQNTGTVQIRFFWWQIQGPVAAIALASSLAGALVALLVSLPAWLSARWRIRGLERRLGGKAPESGGPESRRA